MDRVPASTAVRRRSVSHVDADRLVRRFVHLLRVLADGRLPGGRLAFGHRAAELSNIRAELLSRGVLTPSLEAMSRAHVEAEVLERRGGLL